MLCQKINELLSTYIDGMLNSAQSDELERHLRGCLACRKKHEELQATIKLLHELPEVIPPPEFRVNLAQKLRCLPPPVIHIDPTARSFFRRWHGVAAVAAILLVVLGMAAWGSNQQLKSLMLSFIHQNDQRPEVVDIGPGDPDEILVAVDRKMGNIQKDVTDKNSLSEGESADPTQERFVGEKTQSSQELQTQLPKGVSSLGIKSPSSSEELQSTGEPPLQRQTGQSEDGAVAGFDALQLNQDKELFTADSSEQENTLLRDSREEPASQLMRSQRTTRSLVAAKYMVTLKTSDPDAGKKLKEMATKHGGVMPGDLEKVENAGTLYLSASQVEGFLQDIKQLGKMEYQREVVDLTDEYLQVQDTFLSLLRQSQSSHDQANQKMSTKNQATTLAQLIEAQQKKLGQLNERIERAEVELVLIRK